MKTEFEIAAEVAPSSLQALCPTGIVVSRVSLHVTETATEEMLRAWDGLIDELSDSQPYHAGDYINYLSRVQGVKAARERIARSRSPESLRVATWVCRQVSTERRLISPSYSHSQIVASLNPSEQELWLSKAKGERWSHRQLRAELRQRAAISKDAPNQGPVDQSAARASQAFEVWRVWFQANSPDFTSEQDAEWDESLLPVIVDRVARMSNADFERIMLAREEYQRA